MAHARACCCPSCPTRAPCRVPVPEWRIRSASMGAGPGVQRPHPEVQVSSGLRPQPRTRGEARALAPTARRTPRAKLSARRAPPTPRPAHPQRAGIRFPRRRPRRQRRTPTPSAAPSRRSAPGLGPALGRPRLAPLPPPAHAHRGRDGGGVVGRPRGSCSARE